jgi:hypothetical protein
MRFSPSSGLWLTLLSAALLGALVVYRFDPMTAGFYPPCVFHALTGLQCPGCGTTRALHHLLHGDLAGALRLNAMAFAAVPVGVAATISRRFAYHPATGWGAAVVTAVWWVARNL